jgi:hypothetical protein
MFAPDIQELSCGLPFFLVVGRILKTNQQAFSVLIKQPDIYGLKSNHGLFSGYS